MVKRKKNKEQTLIYKTLHRKLKIEQHRTPLKMEGDADGLAVPASLVTPVMLILKDINIIWNGNVLDTSIRK